MTARERADIEHPAPQHVTVRTNFGIEYVRVNVVRPGTLAGISHITPAGWGWDRNIDLINDRWVLRRSVAHVFGFQGTPSPRKHMLDIIALLYILASNVAKSKGF